MFCTNCGAALTQETGFCARCGKHIVIPDGSESGQQAAVAASPSATAMASSSPADGVAPLEPVSQPATVATIPAMSTAAGLSRNVAGALAYTLGAVTGVIFLVLEPYKNEPSIRFHAMQSILFTAACGVLSIAWRIFWGVVFSISSSLALFVSPLGTVIWLGILGLWVFLIHRAYTGHEYRLPFIGDIAARQVA